MVSPFEHLRRGNGRNIVKVVQMLQIVCNLIRFNAQGLSVLENKTLAENSSWKFFELLRFDRFEQTDAYFCIERDFLDADPVLKPLAA